MERKIKEAILRAVAKAMADIKRDAMRKCPVDTGRLRASIGIRTEGDRIILYADTEYDKFVEFGTVKMHAQPFIRPALHNGVRKYLPERIAEEMKRV